MTEREWHEIVATPGAQALYQALEILRRPLDAWEARVPECVVLRRWAIAVVVLSEIQG